MSNDLLTPVRPPLMRLGVALVVLCMVAGVIGWIVSGNARDGMGSLIATLPGVAVTMLLLAARPEQPAPQWAIPVLAGTIVRAFVVLGIAFGLGATDSFDRRTIVLTALGALLACLATEVGVVMSMINARSADASAPLEGARS